MTPPPTPSRTAVNRISQQSSTPYHQQQQQLSAPQPVYSPMFFPVQANVCYFNDLYFEFNSFFQMPFLPMSGTYLVPQGAPPPVIKFY
jgi:hypothetical protein